MTRSMSLFLLLLATVTVAAASPAANAKGCDGNQSNWNGVPLSAPDGKGDGTITADGRYHSGGDLLGLRIKNTPCEVDFLVELAGVPDTTLNLFLDTDENELTGCQEQLGAEYLLRVVQIPGATVPQVQLFDWRACAVSTDGDLSVGAAFALGRDSIEVSVPVSALQSLTPDTQGFDVFVSTGVAGDTASDFLLPPFRYDARPQFSDSCSNRPESPGHGGAIHAGGFALPPPTLP
jgi:hypothetical protein